jgi:4'-phosphopantetheinyl transferase
MCIVQGQSNQTIQMRSVLAPARRINKSEVHLWTVRLVAASGQIADLNNTLSNDEKRRVDAFRFQKHKNHFIIARGLLRAILGWYLGEPSEHIDFQYGPQGKPMLCQRYKDVLHFNLAHSEDCALYAFTRDCQIGVDLEFVRELPEAVSLARHFFAKEECADLFSIAAEKQAEAFFNCWTRKEAYLKATGKGLSVALDRFQVSLTPGHPAAFLNLPGDPFHISQWTLFHLASLEGYVGAIAIPSRNCVLRERGFDNTEACLTFLKTDES